MLLAVATLNSGSTGLAAVPCLPPTASIPFPKRIASGCEKIGPILRIEYSPLDGPATGILTGQTWSQDSFEPSAFVGLAGPTASGFMLSFPDSAFYLHEDTKQVKIIQQQVGPAGAKLVLGHVSIGETIRPNPTGLVIAGDSVYDFSYLDMADGTTVVIRDLQKNIDLIAVSPDGEPRWSLYLDQASVLEASGLNRLIGEFWGNDSKDGSRFYLWVEGEETGGGGTRRGVLLVLCFNSAGSLQWARKLGFPDLEGSWSLADDSAAQDEGLLLLVEGTRNSEANSVLVKIGPTGELFWSKLVNQPFRDVRSVGPQHIWLGVEEESDGLIHSAFVALDAAGQVRNQVRFAGEVSREGDTPTGRVLLTAEEGRVLGSCSPDLSDFRWQRYLGPASLEIDVDTVGNSVVYVSQPLGANDDPFFWLKSGFDVLVLDEELQAEADCRPFEPAGSPAEGEPVSITLEDTRADWEPIAWTLSAKPLVSERAALEVAELSLSSLPLCDVMQGFPQFKAALTTTGDLEVSFIAAPGFVHSLLAAESLGGVYSEIWKIVGAGERASIKLATTGRARFFKVSRLPAPAPPVLE